MLDEGQGGRASIGRISWAGAPNPRVGPSVRTVKPRVRRGVTGATRGKGSKQNRRDDSARPVDSGYENLADIRRLAWAGVESKNGGKILTATL